MKIPWLVIERKTDILALAAFLLSVITIVTQLCFYFEGAVVTLYPSNRIVFKADTLQPDDAPRMRLAATMAYTNTGAPDHNAVIQRESVAIHLGSDAVYKQEWQSFAIFGVVDGKLVIDKEEPANPLPVLARSGVSHDTYFTPLHRRCEPEQVDCDQWSNYITWSDFMERVSNIENIQVTLTSELYEEEAITASCSITIDENIRNHLKSKGWYSASCWPVED